ncbi:bifunctional metallophosphatase/5'-nucleotidase [Alkalitalea saponilacus]|nr:metallophosphatase [Alkalitalea saponilacus]ASB48004.1 metallophosphatase [Alkalitalea saponilacus]
MKNNSSFKNFTMYYNRQFSNRIYSAIFLMLIFSVFYSCNNANETRITILHTNDLHSHIEPLPENHGRFPGMGGFARISTIINQIRENTEHVLVFDSGDMFQGTPYFNFYEGSLELRLMSKMGYDAATLGNHEFDNGIESLSNQLKYANFPFISTNYDVEGTLLDGKIKEYHIIETGGIRIGIIGLGVDPDGLVAPHHVDGLKWLDPVVTGDKTAELLKTQYHCDIIIALSHLGFDMGEDRFDDLKVAAQSHHIDVILGGHTHRFMEEPRFVTNLSGKEVIIWQSGQNGVQMGRLDFVFRRGKQTELVNASTIAIKLD